MALLLDVPRRSLLRSRRENPSFSLLGIGAEVGAVERLECSFGQE